MVPPDDQAMPAGRHDHRSPPTADPEQTRAGRLCHLHAEALLALAILLVGDGARAERVVVDILVAACDDGRTDHDGAETGRPELAAAVYHRCAAARAHHLPDLRCAPVTRPGPLMALSEDERALVGLVLFGAHDCGRAAATLDVPDTEVLSRLTAAVHTLRDAV